jgi:hypothetical protein
MHLSYVLLIMRGCIVTSLTELEDCSGHEEDKPSNARNYSDDMKRFPTIAKLLPVCDGGGIPAEGKEARYPSKPKEPR